ncbi:MAG: DUF4368 domain-containing protein [Oscillospiraceae bacterium]|jgi:hypothetical protein|nr:DUF4368 domain-containing protein [Oscillospiraceae bacterium]
MGTVKTANVERFLKVIRKHSDVTKLTSAMLHELIERIDIYGWITAYRKLTLR